MILESVEFQQIKYKIKIQQLSKLIIKLQSNVMADYNMHFRNIHLQNLVDQNQELRRRVAKLTEIEGYVELLVDKLEKAQRKEHSMVSQNNLLRQQLRQIQVKYSQSQNMHGDQMRYVFSQHDKLVQEKNAQILQLKNLLEKENVRGGQLQNQFRIQKSHQQKIVSEYQQALLKYRNRGVELQRDLQIIFQSFEQEKMLHAKTKDSWIGESNQFKMAMKQLQIHISQLNQHISQLKDQCNLLSNANQKLQYENHSHLQYNQQLQNKFRYSEQQNAAKISHLNSNNSNLQEKLLLKTSQNQNLQNTNASLMNQIQQLKVVQLHLKSDNQVYVSDNQRLIFLLEEADKENRHLREKHEELQDYSNAEIEKAKIDNLRLREENNVLNKNNSERENYLSGKLIELKEATAARNSLQILNDQAQSQVISLREELHIVQEHLIKEKKLSTQLQIERKQLNQAIILLKQHSLKVEEMNQKIQKQNHDISKANHQMTRLLSNPRQLNKEYVQQIDKILKNFHQEREQQNQRHWIQKEKLKQMYQYEFKQKQMQMLRQISLLQQELAKVNRFEILTERTFNKITPNKNVNKL